LYQIYEEKMKSINHKGHKGCEVLRSCGLALSAEASA